MEAIILAVVVPGCSVIMIKFANHTRERSVNERRLARLRNRTLKSTTT